MSVSQATKPTGMMSGEMAQSNALADRDEAFNTRLGSMRGWQMAIERVGPFPEILLEAKSVPTGAGCRAWIVAGCCTAFRAAIL